MIFRVIVICIIAIKLVFPANVLNRSFSIPDLMKPGQIQVIDNRLFVTEKGSVLVIDLKNGELIRKFGKRGEGPGEFAGVIKIHPVENKIMVSSTGKISIFTLKGILIREVKIDGNSGISGNFQPLARGLSEWAQMWTKGQALELLVFIIRTLISYVKFTEVISDPDLILQQEIKIFSKSHFPSG